MREARKTLELQGQVEDAGGSSGGEEVSAAFRMESILLQVARILAEARAKYGKVRGLAQEGPVRLQV